MNYSVYHLFCNLVEYKEKLIRLKHLDKFPFEVKMLSCKNKGKFPDLAIKLNRGNSHFSGGELIELKDSKTYTVSSFNSTIPMGSKDISDLVQGKRNTILEQMEKAGNDILSLPVRDVFYLVRGRRNKCVKVSLTHGKFFETISPSSLISQSFLQAVEERLAESGEHVPENLKNLIAKLFIEQETFSKTRTVNKASVRLRFRIMTEVLAEGNILNSGKYPEVKDNTLNFVVPSHSKEEENRHKERMKRAFNERNASALFKHLEIFTLRHHFNGPFLVFQKSLS